MKNCFLTLTLLLTAKIFTAQHNTDHVIGQALIMLKPGAAMIDEVGKKHGYHVIKAVSKRMNIFLLELDNISANENEKLAEITSDTDVAIAQFNHYVHERAVPNDAFFSSMWGLHNTGQNGGTVDADIDAPEAWDITTGGVTASGDTIVVAVIDGGFQISHPDVSYWKNYHETPSNGIDDDGNGYIDDVNGWNAYNSNGTISNGGSHGTHVAGTVGARGNNTSGTAGVSWNVKVMAVQGSSSTEAEVVEAYAYVRDTRLLYDQTNGAKGAFVVATNSSFGVDNGQPTNFPLWCAMYDSLGYAGIISAGATANQNYNIDVTGDIPTACASQFLISVTNTTRNDVKYSGAGYGATTIDIGAPGTSVYSTVPTSSWAMQGWIGTSMATPHVAGTIGLMYAAACQQFIMDYKNDPSGKALTMVNYLLSGADVLSSMNGLCTTNGRLNAYNALLNVQTYSGCAVTSINEAEVGGEMKNVFPNPAGEFAEIEYLSNRDNFKVIIKDCLGHTVKSQDRFNHKGINRHLVDLSDLAPGVYFVGVEGGTLMKLIHF